jgi:hypothetical protein
MVTWLGRLAAACAFLLAFGLVWLFAYVVAEAIVGEGHGSLVDAYWMGRLPWMGIAAALIVVGASVCVASGALTVLVASGWWRRVAVIPLVALTGFWWVVAMIAFPGGAPCPACPPPEPDPWAYAYSLPSETLVGLLLPALAAVLLALWPRRERAPQAARHSYISPS